MNVLIVYFSQTGNTRKVAEAIAGVMEAKGLGVRTVPMASASPTDIAGCDVLGFGTPCFESQAPVPVKEWLSTLPSMRGRPAFVFATSAGAPGRVLYDLTRTLHIKGAPVVGGFMSRGEVHHPAPCLKGRLPGRPDKEDLERARVFARNLADHLQSGSTGLVPGGRNDVSAMPWGFYGLASLIAQPFLLRILLPRPNTDGGACTSCGLCGKECPVGCMTGTPHPKPGPSCIRCYRCQNVCPEKAVSSGWAFGNLVIFALYNTLFTRIFGEVGLFERVYRVRRGEK